MFVRKKDIFASIFIFFLDIAVLSVGWVLSFVIRFFTALSSPKGIPQSTVYFKLIPFIILCWLLVYILNLNSGRRYYENKTKYLKIVMDVSLMVGMFICLSYFYTEYRYSRLTLVLFWVLSPMLLFVTRKSVLKVVGFFTNQKFHKNILIISDGTNCNEMDKVVQYVVDGCCYKKINLLADFENGLCQLRSESLGIVLSDNKSWKEFYAQKYFSSAIVGISYKNYQFMSHLLGYMVNDVPDIRIVSDMNHFGGFNKKVESFGDMSLVTVNDSPLKEGRLVSKRFFDFTVSLFATVALSPFLVFIFFLIKMKSSGSALFKQKRMGLDGKLFTMYKFRTMYVSDSTIESEVWTSKGDTRVTALGRILRRTSLDELPQLFNVLRGDMSLVGPRPERPYFVKEFRKNIPGYMLRHKVKSGITGWAQVNGLRGDTSIENRVEYDLYYIKNWSIQLDCLILVRTLLGSGIDPNAY